MAASTAASLIVVLLGMALLFGIRRSAISVSGVAFRRPFAPQIPGILIGPRAAVLSHTNAVLAPVGLLFLLVGLIGLSVLLWIWKPWSGRRGGGATDRDIGMPSYL
jgi:hypothetical protein